MALEHDSDSALALAVRKAGSQTAFGELIGKRQSTVHDWLREGKPLPSELVLLVEGKLGIPRHELRPDIYPPEEYQSSGTGPGEARPADRSTAGRVSTPPDPLQGLRA